MIRLTPIIQSKCLNCFKLDTFSKTREGYLLHRIVIVTQMKSEYAPSHATTHPKPPSPPSDYHMPYEGAGFLMVYKKSGGAALFVLGIREKKPEDAAKDPTVELEYAGGKPDPEDQNDPLQTAYAELVEEFGQDVLDKDWRNRVVPVHTFQKFSKKWIWCSLLFLSDNEYARVCSADRALDSWDPSEKRDMCAITKRKTPVRKGLKALVAVNAGQMLDYMSKFKGMPVSDNRMNDAKQFRNTHVLNGFRLSTLAPVSHPLRGFNAVIFEEHVDTIRSKLQ